MNVRRLLVATTAAVALLASTPASAAGTITLDGKRLQSKTWSGRLEETALPATATTNFSMDPTPNDCASATQCDIKTLRLTLPKGVSGGAFDVRVKVEWPLAAYVGVYNPKGELVASSDVVGCCGVINGEYLYEYNLTIRDTRWDPGRYTLAIINRGGQGPYTATVGWTANPPDRRKR